MDSAITSADRLEKVEEQARKRVRQIRDFYSHLATYLVVNALLVAINLWTSPGSFWAIWPLMGWGIGIASHAVEVFGLFGIGSREWEERKVQELMLSSQQLTADEVRDLLREELPAASGPEVERIVRRLEHLEAIVTSRDWDILEGREPSPLSADPLLSVDSQRPQDETARIARKVR